MLNQCTTKPQNTKHFLSTDTYIFTTIKYDVCWRFISYVLVYNWSSQTISADFLYFFFELNATKWFLAVSTFVRIVTGNQLTEMIELTNFDNFFLFLFVHLIFFIHLLCFFLFNEWTNREWLSKSAKSLLSFLVI